MNDTYQSWLVEHLKGAKEHYKALCKLDDEALKTSDSSEYYEQAQQMFGYIAALEKCLRELKTTAAASAAPALKAKAPGKTKIAVSTKTQGPLKTLTKAKPQAKG